MLLLPLLVLVVFAFVAMSLARRAALRRAEYEEELAREAAERGPSRAGGDDPPPPLGMSPLGSLLEQMMSGPAWGRSYEVDPETGRWVDVTERQPEPAPPQEAQANARRQRKAPHRTQQQSPLGSLFGGGLMGGDGSGDFEVQPPDELTT